MSSNTVDSDMLVVLKTCSFSVVVPMELLKVVKVSRLINSILISCILIFIIDPLLRLF